MTCIWAGRPEHYAQVNPDFSRRLILPIGKRRRLCALLLPWSLRAMQGSGFRRIARSSSGFCCDAIDIGDGDVVNVALMYYLIDRCKQTLHVCVVTWKSKESLVRSMWESQPCVTPRKRNDQFFPFFMNINDALDFISRKGIIDSSVKQVKLQAFILTTTEPQSTFLPELHWQGFNWSDDETMNTRIYWYLVSLHPFHGY